MRQKLSLGYMSGGEQGIRSDGEDIEIKETHSVSSGSSYYSDENNGDGEEEVIQEEAVEKEDSEGSDNPPNE